MLPILVPILAPLKKLAASSLMKMSWSTGLNDGGEPKKDESKDGNESEENPENEPKDKSAIDQR